MGSQRSTSEVPVVLRRSQRHVNRQKSIPIESLLNSGPEIDPLVSNFIQDSTYFTEDSFINQDRSENKNCSTIKPEYGLSKQNLAYPNTTVSAHNPEYDINQSLAVAVVSPEYDTNKNMIKTKRCDSNIAAAMNTTQEQMDYQPVGSSESASVTTPEKTQADSSENAPISMVEETPVPDEPNTSVLRSKRKRKVVNYQAILDFDEFEESEEDEVDLVPKKKTKPKKKITPKKNANTGTMDTTKASTRGTDSTSITMNNTLTVAATTPKKSTRGRKPKSATIATKKTVAISKEAVDSQQKPPEIEYDQEALRFLLQDPTSYLTSADLKTMIPKLLSKLPEQDLNELAELLPYTDKAPNGSFSPNFMSASNNFFWEATTKWQDVLYLGGFDEVKLANKKEKEKVQEDTTFKDDNYESYWGERLKRDREMKEQNAKKRTTRKRK